MVTFTKEDKNIVIPNSLGNFSTGSGGSGVTPEDVEIMIDQAIDTYDEGIQGQFDSTNTAVSGNTENIEAISAKTQSIVNDLNSLGNSVENLSAVTSGISNDLTSLGNDVEELSGVTSGISNDLTGLGNDVESLSGKTEEIEGRLRNYTTTAVTAELSAVTSGIATDLETLSANTTVVSWEQSLSAGTQIAQITINGQSQSVYAPEGAASDAVIYDYDEVRSLSTNEKIAVWRKMLQEKADGKQVWFRRILSEHIYWYIMNFAAVTGAHLFYAFDNNYIYTLSFNYNGVFAPSLSLSQKEILPKASSSTLGGIKVGSGLTIDGNGVLSADGGGGASKTIVNIDTLSQSELVDLYNTLSGATSADSINEHYEFYYTFGDNDYGLTEGPIRLQFLYPQGSVVTFGASCYDGQYQNIVAYSVRLNSDGTYDYYFDKIDKTFGLETQRIFRDYWYVYYDTTTSGFSYGVDQELTPITWGTGTTCSGEWIFNRDFIYQYLGSPIKAENALYFNLRVKTAEGTRIYGYPSFSRVVLDTPVTFTNEQGESVSFTDKVYFDYGDCVLSFYFENNWRFGGMQITFR